jgi:8-oxo-dGTP diphosphatase
MGAYAPIEVGCEAYIVRAGRILLGKRKNVFGDGTWGMPGGRTELMERAGDTVIREVREELGITITPEAVEFLALTDDPNPERNSHHLHLTFKVDIGSAEPKVMEPQACSEWRWHDLQALPAAIFPPHALILQTIATGQPYRPR